MKKFDALKIGLAGFAMIFFINLIGIFFLNKSSSDFFSDGWWSSWFTVYIVWFVFAIVGIRQKFNEMRRC